MRESFEGARLRVVTITGMLVAGAVLAGCSDSPSAPGGSNASKGSGTTVSLGIALGAGAPQASAGPAFDLVLVDDVSTLEIQRVAVVLREIELKLENDDAVCGDSGSGSSSSRSSRDGCDELEVGPFLLDLPLDGGVETLIELTDVLPGRYDRLDFEIHKPEDDTPEDLAFIAAHPEFRRISITVEGLFDGQPFTYVTDLSEKQRVDLLPPLDVGAGDLTQVTLVLDVAGWFRRSDGSLVDPASGNKGGPNENLIKDNIRRSIEGFEDDDRDGRRS